MFKKIALAVLAIAFVAGLGSCAAKYADLKDVMEKMVAATDTLVTSMDKANDAKAVAASLNAYTESLKGLQADFKKLMEKYPELKDAKDPPAELKETTDKLNGMGEKLMTAMAKLQTYAADQEVMDAIQKMTELQME